MVSYMHCYIATINFNTMCYVLKWHAKNINDFNITKPNFNVTALVRSLK